MLICADGNSWLRNDKMKRASNFIIAYRYSVLGSKWQQQNTSRTNAPKAEDLHILTVAIASNAFSGADLVEQMMTFLAAGHETTASALTWAIYLLAKHPQMQSRLRDETRAHLLSPFVTTSPSASAVIAEMIEQMPYLNAIRREVLRLFPPVVLTMPIAVKDTSISGHLIP
jgi:cytochrome P450